MAFEFEVRIFLLGEILNELCGWHFFVPVDLDVEFADQIVYFGFAFFLNLEERRVRLVVLAQAPPRVLNLLEFVAQLLFRHEGEVRHRQLVVLHDVVDLGSQLL